MTGRTLIVGAGPFGLTLARCLTDAGHPVLVIERRPVVGGNATDRLEQGMRMHPYGIHIFHTSDDGVWSFVNRFSDWIPYQLHVMCRTLCGVMPLPFTMDFYSRFYRCTTPAEMDALLASFQQDYPSGDDLRSWAISQLGTQAFDLLVEGYTEKQWGRGCATLPSSILRRLVVRRSWETRYFDDTYEGLPAKGYQALWTAMADQIPVECGVDFLADRPYWEGQADRIVFTGPLDALWEYCHGPLEYRSLRFEQEIYHGPVQGCVQMNSSLRTDLWTRTYEWGYLPPNVRPQGQTVSLLTREFPLPYSPGSEPFYPIRTPDNIARAKAYQSETASTGFYHLGGRLGTFRYYDMHQAIRAAMTCAEKLLKGLPTEGITD